MARPRELYSGAAPQAMSMMGAGIADAYANAGRIEGQGMQALGQGIAQGITAMGQAYGDYKKMQSQVKADSAAFDSFKNYLPAEFVNKQQALENNPSASLLDKQQFYQSAKGYLGAAIGQKYKMDQIGAEVGGRMLAAQAGREPVPDLSGMGEGLRVATGTQFAPSSPTALQPAPSGSSEMEPKPLQVPRTPSFDARKGADMLAQYMSETYGPNWRERGIKPSEADMKALGFK